MTVFLWVLAVAMMAIGVAGTILPALPGPTLVFAGILAALSWVVDLAAGAAGAKRVGASPWAIAGAAIGTVAGVFTGFVGLLFLPLAGAAIGEYLAKRDVRVAGKAGVATWLGLLVGTALKVAIVFAMLGLFAGSLIFN